MNFKLLPKYIKFYLVTFLLIVIPLVPIYLTIFYNTKSKVLDRASDNLNQGMLSLDAKINKMNSMSDILQNYEYIQKISKIQASPTAKDTFSLIKAREYISACINLGFDNANVYMIFNNNWVLLTHYPILSSYQYHEYQPYLIGSDNYREFKTKVFSSDRRIIFLSNYESEKHFGFTAIIRSTNTLSSNYDSALVYDIDEETLTSLFMNKGKEQNDSFYYIADGNNNILHADNYDGMYIDMAGNDRISSRINGKKYTLLKTRSDISGLNAVVGISNDIINGQIATINTIITTYITAYILGMLFISLVFAYRKSRNVQSLVEILNRDRTGSERIRNEYTYIANKINNLWAENDNYKERVERLNRSAGDSMLARMLINGIYSNKEKEEVIEYIGFKIEFYCVLCADLVSEGSDSSLSRLLSIDRLLREKYIYFPVMTDINERSYIVLLPADEPLMFDRLISGISGVPDIKIGISQIGEGLENIHFCYSQAKLALRQIGLQSERKIRHYDRQLTSDATFSYRHNLHNQIYDLIIQGEIEQVDHLFSIIQKHIEKSVWNNESEVQQFYYEISLPIMRAYSELPVDENAIKKPVYNSKTNISALISEIKQTADLLCELVNSNKNNEKAGFIQKMINLANDNFNSPEMCVAFMADRLGITDKYFISLFKDSVGENFSHFIEVKRMEYAVGLLSNTNLTMGLVAQKSGYNTLDAFYKCFKKYYHMPPGKYKEMIGNKKETNIN